MKISGIEKSIFCLIVLLVILFVVFNVMVADELSAGLEEVEKTGLKPIFEKIWNGTGESSP